MQKSLDLPELIHLLLSKLWLILLVSVIGFLMAFGYTKLLVSPQYTSSVKFYISNTSTSSSTLNINDLNASEKLVTLDIEVLKSNKVLNQVIDTMHLNCTAEQLKKMLTITSPNDTGMMVVEVTTSGAQLSSDIANTIAAVAPDQIIEVTKAGYVELVDEATPNPVPSSPNTVLNCAVGFLLGLILSILYVVVREMFDMRVKGEEDLKKYYNIPILGGIPDFHSQFKGGYERYER